MQARTSLVWHKRDRITAIEGQHASGGARARRENGWKKGAVRCDGDEGSRAEATCEANDGGE